MMHFLLTNKTELMVSRSVIQAGVNSTTIVSADVVLGHDDNVKIDLKEKVVFIYKKIKLDLIVLNFSILEDNEKVIITVKLVDQLHLSKFSGGVYLYNGKVIEVFNKLLKKYGYNSFKGVKGYGNNTTIVQLPYNSDYDLILLLANVLKLRFFLEENSIYSVDEQDFYSIDTLVIKFEFNINNDLLIYYHLEDPKLYVNRRIQFNGNLYYIKEQNIEILETGIITGRLLLTNKIEYVEPLNSNSVFVEGVIIEERVPHILYVVKIRFGGEFKAKVLNYSDNNDQNNTNIRYCNGQKVLLICSVSYNEVWILGCVDLTSEMENLPGCKYKYNEFSFENNNKLLSDNSKIQVSVGRTLAKISAKNKGGDTIKYFGDRIEASSFQYIETTNSIYNIKSNKYMIDAVEYIMIAKSMLSLGADKQEIFSKNIKVNLNKAYYKFKKMIIKNKSLQAKVGKSRLVGKIITLKCNNLIVSASSVCLSTSDSQILLQDDKINLSSGNLSINASLIQFNGIISGGVAIKKDVQKIKESKFEEYDEGFANKEQELIIKDEAENILGKMGGSIVDGVNVTLDSQKYKVMNNKITFTTSSRLSDVIMD